MRLICPHCSARASSYSSSPMSTLTRHAYFRCANGDCGFSFKVAVEIVATISPSAMPNPAIVLPMCKGVGKNGARQPLRPFALPQQEPALAEPVQA